MIVNLKGKDKTKFDELVEINNKNINISDMLLTAFYYVDFINKEEVSASENEINAIIENIKNNFEDDPDSKDIDSHIYLKCLDEKDYLTEYSEKLFNINVRFKNYHFKKVAYEPYQLFSYDDIDVKDNIEISKVGYFKSKFEYLALFEGNNMWMSLNPNEITTMKPYVDEASGNVLVLGLGMGYITYMLSKKSEIKSITVVEKNRDNIIFFNKYIAQIFDKYKIKIIEDDAIKFVDQFNRYDYIFADLWFTPEDGIEYYLKLKKIEAKRNIKIHYWLEKSLHQMKRRYLIEFVNEIIHGSTAENYISNETIEDRIFKEIYLENKNTIINTFDDIKKLLK